MSVVLVVLFNMARTDVLKLTVSMIVPSLGQW